jgi:hypothetical protein
MTPHPVPTTFFRSPKLQRQLERRARQPAATAAQAAEAHGLTHGSLNLHHIPWLNFQTPEEWIAWLNGWRRGQARRNERYARHA